MEKTQNVQQVVTKDVIQTKEQTSIEQAQQNNEQNKKNVCDIKSTLTPKTVYARMHLDHIGRIFSNIGIVASVLSLFAILVPLLLPLYFLAILIISICACVFTLGLIFLTESSFLPNLWSTVGNVEVIMQYVSVIIPILFGVAVISSILGITLMLFSKQKCTWRIATNSIILILPIVAFIIILLGVIA